jgi:hypothetical protein
MKDLDYKLVGLQIILIRARTAEISCTHHLNHVKGKLSRVGERGILSSHSFQKAIA